MRRCLNIAKACLQEANASVSSVARLAGANPCTGFAQRAALLPGGGLPRTLLPSVRPFTSTTTPLFSSSDDSNDSSDEDVDTVFSDPVEPDGNNYSLQDSVVSIDGPAPSFSGTAVVEGDISWLDSNEYAGSWVLLFFYPKDFTFVCPTEIIAFSDAAKDFREENCAVIGASCDSAEVHLAWMRTPRNKGGLGNLNIPLIADVDRRVSKSYGTLNADNFPNRGIFLISPEGLVRSMSIVNNSIGRSVDESMRQLKALQYVEEHGVVCPANWQPGERTMKGNFDESLEYFEGTHDSSSEPDFGQSLTSVTSKDELQRYIADSERLVVDFMAGHCGKCRQISPTVEQLQEQYQGDIKFVKLDVSDPAFEDFVKEEGIDALPMFKFYVQGELAVPDIIGYKKRPLQQAVEKLSSM